MCAMCTTCWNESDTGSDLFHFSVSLSAVAILLPRADVRSCLDLVLGCSSMTGWT